MCWLKCPCSGTHRNHIAATDHTKSTLLIYFASFHLLFSIHWEYLSTISALRWEGNCKSIDQLLKGGWGAKGVNISNFQFVRRNCQQNLVGQPTKIIRLTLNPYFLLTVLFYSQTNDRFLILPNIWKLLLRILSIV